MISDAAVKKATGKDWKEWFAVLDKAGAKKLDHQGICAIADQLGAPPWWSQMVTVTYEQERGLREVHQKADGYAASASKTVALPLPDLYQAFQLRVRKEKGIEITKATPNKSIRLRASNGSRISVNFYAKGQAKSQVALQHEKLPGAADVAKKKKYWGDLLTHLG
jgi:hypothetical protein